MMHLDNRTSSRANVKKPKRDSLWNRRSIFLCIVFPFLPFCFESCLTPPTAGVDDGTITDLTYQNTHIGLSISAPSHDWSITNDVPDPSKVLIIKYFSTVFNPNVVVSASLNFEGDSIPLLTQASIAEFCNDSTYSNKSILYNDQSVVTINGSSFGMVEAYVTKSYTNPTSQQQIALKIIQYVTVHNGYVLAITFVDTQTDFNSIDAEFVTIRNSIRLL